MTPEQFATLLRLHQPSKIELAGGQRYCLHDKQTWPCSVALCLVTIAQLINELDAYQGALLMLSQWPEPENGPTTKEAALDWLQRHPRKVMQ
jgi:hypothetical protein